MPRRLFWPVRSPVIRWPVRFEAAELLDVDVDQLARALALVAPHRLGRLQRRDTVEPEPAQHTADGGGRHADIARNLMPGEALAPQGLDPFHRSARRRTMQAVRARRAILHPRHAVAGISGEPLPDRPRADACGSCGGLRRLPALHLPNQSLSTHRRQTGILVKVHPVLSSDSEASQPQPPRSGPNAQPIESSP
jgi:hypothetical protein